MTDLLKLFLQEQKVKTTKRKTLPFICLHSFLSPHEQDIALIIVFYVCSNLLMTLQHGCTVITNDVALVTIVVFSKRAWQSWGTIIFMRLYPNTTFHLLTTNLKKHLVSLDAHLQNLIHLPRWKSY